VAYLRQIVLNLLNRQQDAQKQLTIPTLGQITIDAHWQIKFSISFWDKVRRWEPDAVLC